MALMFVVARIPATALPDLISRRCLSQLKHFGNISTSMAVISLGFPLKFFETEILHFKFSVTKLIGHPKQNSNLLSNKSN